MIKFNGQKVIEVDGVDSLYLSYKIVDALGECISTVAQRVLIDVQKQNRNLAKQAERDGQPASSLAAHFRFNGDDVVVKDGDTPEGVRQAYLNMLQKRSDDYDASPEGSEKIRKRKEEIELKTEAANNLLVSIMRQSHLYKNRGALHQPIGTAAEELMQDLYNFIKLADDIPGANWDQEVFIESMERFNYVSGQYVGKDKSEFTAAAVKRGYIVGQAMNFLEENGGFHQMLLMLLERYFKNPAGEIKNEKRNGGEPPDA